MHLRIAKKAQEMEKNAMSKLQEVQLTDNTTVGISQNGAVTEWGAVTSQLFGQRFSRAV